MTYPSSGNFDRSAGIRGIVGVAIAVGEAVSVGKKVAVNGTGVKVGAAGVTPLPTGTAQAARNASKMSQEWILCIFINYLASRAQNLWGKWVVVCVFLPGFVQTYCNKKLPQVGEPGSPTGGCRANAFFILHPSEFILNMTFVTCKQA
jgi:hypothetical protein